jgi:undecaprenyl diphosphate synthase
MQTKRREDMHVAIIMDGNGRWAMRRGLPRVAGHRAGVAAARRVVERAVDLNIARLTLYAFSSDNWRRPLAEVQSIFWLLRAFLRLETRRLKDRGVRLRMIGRRDRLPESALRAIERTEAETAAGRSLDLCVAIDYSSRDAITRAVAQARMSLPHGEPPSLDGFRMLMGQQSDVDLLIRTGGEKRLSDFLLWESAYAELLFTDRMWPDFDEADLDAALEEFHCRERRFGAMPAAAV